MDGGRILSISKVMRSFISLYHNDEFKRVLLAVVFVALFIFVGVNYIGFYISGAIFMFVILMTFVKNMKRKLTWSIIFSILYSVILFVIFKMIFKIPL
jgi:putative tricarboxylic transport membrane protein